MAEKLIIKAISPVTKTVVKAEKNIFRLKNTGGPTGAKGDRGDKGEKGDTGATGATGKAATIAIGTVTTGSPDAPAAVANVGTDTSAVFDFTIPQGIKGEKGEVGDDGTAATVQVGTVTTGAAGTQAAVENIGTATAAVFNFTIPRGDKGEAGAGAGDMLASEYDPTGVVQNAGGIPNYVATHSTSITKTSELTNDGADGTSTYVENDELASVAKSGSYTDLTNKPSIPTATSDITNDSDFTTNAAVQSEMATKQDKLTAGDHINITDNTIKATGYVASNEVVATSQTEAVVTNTMIADGTITAAKTATGEFLKLTLSTSDIGEGAALEANTLYGVYT